MLDEHNIFRDWFAQQHHYSGLRPIPELAAGVHPSPNRPPGNMLDDEAVETDCAATQFEAEYTQLSALAALPDGAEMSTEDLEALGAKICAFASRLASAMCVWLMMIAEFDRQEGWTGTKSCAHWLSWACSVAPGTAREHVRVARTMMQMPLVLEEFGRGRLSYSKVRELTRIHAMVPEQELVDLAKVMTASQLAKSVRGFRRHHPDRLQQELRRRTRWYVDTDGSVVLQARLPAEEGALLVAALESAHELLERVEQERLRTEISAEPSPSKIGQSEALLHLATLQLDTAPAEVSGADRHLVVVHVDSHLLVDSPQIPTPRTDQDSPLDLTAIPARGACQIQGVGGISSLTAARLACDAVITTLVRSSGGAVLAHGRKHRLVQAAQRRALMVRDGQCRQPGCDRTTYLEAHHVKHWAAGGNTDLDNLVLLCRLHHMGCHEGGVTISDGLESRTGLPSWEFRSPDGMLLGGSWDQTAGSYEPADAALWNGIDEIASSDSEEAERIRPLWAGERFSLQDILSHLYGRIPTRIEDAAA